MDTVRYGPTAAPSCQECGTPALNMLGEPIFLYAKVAKRIKCARCGVVTHVTLLGAGLVEQQEDLLRETGATVATFDIEPAEEHPRI